MQNSGLALIVSIAVIARALAIYRLICRAHPAHVLMTLYAGFFFAPLYVLGPITGAFVIGLGHAFQYQAIMTVLASNRKQGSRPVRIAGLLVCGAMVASAYAVLNYGALWGSWAQLASLAYLCIGMWHFIVDADVWRLREPFQRQTLRESIPYLFAPR